MKTKPLNGCLAKSRMISTRATEAQDRSDERHDHDRPMRRRRLFPTADPRQKRGDMPSRCRSREKALYNLPLPERGRGGDHAKDAAAEEPAAGRSITKPYNQAPAYIRGPGTLA
jgi:hypothetical protein